MILLVLVLAAVSVTLAVLLIRMRARYARVVDVEKERARVADERDKLAARIKKRRAAWKTEYEETVSELSQLNDQLVSTRDQVAMESFGLYEPIFDFEDPEDFKKKLKEIRAEQKDMLRGKTAAVCQTEWTVEGSKAKGRTMTNRQLRLMLRAFNGECDAAMGKVRYNNVGTLEKRIERAFKAINKLGESNTCSITHKFLAFKLDELHLVHELREKLQAVREEQKAIRQQMREEARAQREIEKARAEAEKEESRYDKALTRARAEVTKATGAKHDKLQAQIAELEERLEEAHEAKERAISRAQLTKSGHVYVVSNVGSFGERAYKIGMTRRLNPIDRVKELSDASVPFPFDVHAMIYSKNAPTLEVALHREFSNRRMNKVNHRKEFFEVEIGEIVAAIRANPDEDTAEVTFTMAAEAEEYRRTLALISASEEREGPSSTDQVRTSFEARMKSW